MNDAFRSITGARNALGRPLGEAIPDIAEQNFAAMLDQVYETGATYNGRGESLLLSRSDGGPRQEFFLDFIHSPIRDADGGVSGVLTVGYDVSTRVPPKSVFGER
jgi:hypothetical protein